MKLPFDDVIRMLGKIGNIYCLKMYLLRMLITARSPGLPGTAVNRADCKGNVCSFFFRLKLWIQKQKSAQH